MLRISVIGAGYVGLVSGACLSQFGFQVTCMDSDKEKVARLRRTEIPIYEPELDRMVKEHIAAGRLRFTSEYREAMDGADVVFIAVGTPSDVDGSADLRYVIQAANLIGAHMGQYTVVVDKSTVPVGTGQLVKQTIFSALKNRELTIPFDVVSNPEFLREGSAVKDFMEPDRIVVGVESDRARTVMGTLYGQLAEEGRDIIFCDIETAELIKYASNAYLATRITFINELALLCEEIGADVSKVSAAMGADHRIGPKYLMAGPGYGGSCFPKDTRALVSIGRDYGVNMSVVETVIRANDNQRRHIVKRITNGLGGAKGRNIAVLGLAFKPDTDDVRESPAVGIVKDLIYRGAQVSVYDPVSMENTKSGALAQLNVSFADSAMTAVRDVDAVVIATEWEEFKHLDMEKVRSLIRGTHLFDLRNLFERTAMESLGFTYYGVGR